MATLEEFLRTGHVGPLLLGMTPSDVMIALGDPQEISAKSNPLQLRYGSLRLSFWKSSLDQIQHLREIAISYDKRPSSLPKPLAFTDWRPRGTPTARQFMSFLTRIDYLPAYSLEGPDAKRLFFFSGVRALFTDEMLQSIQLVQRSTKESIPSFLSDEREPTTKQILDMLKEAERARRTRAYRAAFLIAWAALEATLRRAALHAGGKGKIGIPPSILIRELFAGGKLTPTEHKILEELRQLRMTSAHGLAPVTFHVDNIRKVNAITKRLLLAEPPTNERGMRQSESAHPAEN